MAPPAFPCLPKPCFDVLLCCVVFADKTPKTPSQHRQRPLVCDWCIWLVLLGGVDACYLSFGGIDVWACQFSPVREQPGHRQILDLRAGKTESIRHIPSSSPCRRQSEAEWGNVTHVERSVTVNGIPSERFTVEPAVRQGCVTSPNCCKLLLIKNNRRRRRSNCEFS